MSSNRCIFSAVTKNFIVNNFGVSSWNILCSCASKSNGNASFLVLCLASATSNSLGCRERRKYSIRKWMFHFQVGPCKKMYIVLLSLGKRQVMFLPSLTVRKLQVFKLAK